MEIRYIRLVWLRALCARHFPFMLFLRERRGQKGNVARGETEGWRCSQQRVFSDTSRLIL